MKVEQFRWIQIFRVVIFLLIAAGSVAAVSRSGPKKKTTGLPLRQFQSNLFLGPGNCAICHTSDGSVLMTSNGTDVSMPKDWRSTMMANAFKDPYFHAVIEEEIKRRPALQSLIEDECLTCHSPMGRTEHYYNNAHANPPINTPYTLAAARQSVLAKDGVSCTVCHQIQPDNLGTAASFSGHYVINDSHVIYGPYDDVDPFFMQSSVGFTPVFGAHKQDSALCATCHTLLTPIVNDSNEIIGHFPEQTPYQEWKNSVYSSVGNLQSCQDCHMARSTEPIAITNFPPGDPRLPFWRHLFVGGNVFMLQMLSNNITPLALTASTENFDETISNTRALLQNRTAELAIAKIDEVSSDTLRVQVRVTNYAGHKLPTAYPRRRAWIHFTAKDRTTGVPFFESGSFDADYEIHGLDLPFEPHHDIITDQNQVQIYESIIGDLNGDVANHLLSATHYLKDNRLPPKGFKSDGPDVDLTGIQGVDAADTNFNRNAAGEGSGSDIVTYELPLNIAPENVLIEAELLFQTIPPRHVNFLRTDPTPSTQIFLDMYDAMENEPIQIAKDSKAGVPPGDLWTIY